MKQPKNNWHLLDISKLVKADWNYKEDNPELLVKLIANIKENDQVQNILVRPLGDKYEVVNGNHRLDAMLQLGYAEVMVYDLGEISLDKAKRIAVETNETRFETDYYALGEILAELSEAYDVVDLSETMPFTEGEILDNIDMINYDPGLDESGLSGNSEPGEPMDDQITIIFGFEEAAEIKKEVNEIIKRFSTARLK